MLEKEDMKPIIETKAPVGSDLTDLTSVDGAVEENDKETRPVERFIVRGWKAQMQIAKEKFRAHTEKAFLDSLETLTHGDWGHYDDESLAVYAETESIAVSYVATAFDLASRGMVVKMSEDTES